jgi:hypothetical protein
MFYSYNMYDESDGEDGTVGKFIAYIYSPNFIVCLPTQSPKRSLDILPHGVISPMLCA